MFFFFLCFLCSKLQAKIASCVGCAIEISMFQTSSCSHENCYWVRASAHRVLHNIHITPTSLLPAYACVHVPFFKAVRLAGTEEPQWRSAAVQQWAGSAAASSVGTAYLQAFETVLEAPLAEDTALVAETNESLKARAAVDKEFAHYVGKLAELRLQKADAKKLARNQV